MRVSSWYVYLGILKVCTLFAHLYIEASRRLTSTVAKGQPRKQGPGADRAHGVVHAWVGQKLLKCNEIKSLLSVLAKDELRATRLLAKATGELS